MRDFLRMLGFTLIVINTVLYFAFSSMKGYSGRPQLILIIIGVIVTICTYIPSKKKSSKYGY